MQAAFSSGGDTPASQSPLPDGRNRMGWMQRRRALEWACLLLCMIAIAAGAWQNVQAGRSAVLVQHTLDVREKSERVLGLLLDAETGQRGFLLTGASEYLEPFDAAVEAIARDLDDLAAAISDNPEQVARLTRIRTVAGEKVAELKQTIAFWRSGEREKALDMVRSGRGKTLMDDARLQLMTFKAHQTALLVSREETGRRLRFAGSFLVFGAMAVLLALLVAQARSIYRNQEKLIVSTGDLQAMVDEKTRLLEQSRDRAEALLNDTNHRVGNSLAMVSSLLSVQRRTSSDPEVREALAAATARVHGVAIAQRRLRLDIATDVVMAKRYFAETLAELGATAADRGLTLNQDVVDVPLSGRNAVSLIVIVNELLMNAIKHAFADGDDGAVTIALRPAAGGDGALELVIEDDGRGIDPEQRSDGIGAMVVTNLVRGLRGAMVVGTGAARPGRPGTRISIIFPGLASPQTPEA